MASDVVTAPAFQPASDALAQAPQWKLTWSAFTRHKPAVASLIFIILLYLVAVFVEFFAPGDPYATDRLATFHPPQQIHWLDTADDGSTRFAPHVYESKRLRDPVSLKTSYQPDPEAKVYLRFLAEGAPYQLWGAIPGNLHFIAPDDPGKSLYFAGADRLGRDVLSRSIYGIRLSLSIGFVGVVLSLVIGVVLGALSGYAGGWVDTVIQRVIEFMMSVPTIPIYLGLAAAIPDDWPPIYSFLAIVLILSLLGWTDLARIVRGRFLALKQEDYVVAARLDGARTSRVIFRHMLPAMTSQIIASVSLAIPAMIIVETSLSFLGLGLQPPAISWGVLLQEAQNIQSLSDAAWLFFPGVLILLTVLSFNFIGDGMRDAADPYNQRD